MIEILLSAMDYLGRVMYQVLAGPLIREGVFRSGFIWGLAISLMIGLIASRIVFLLQRVQTQLGHKPTRRGQVITYREKVETLTAKLTRASSELDSILAEMTLISQGRERALETLERKLQELSTREKEMQKRVGALEKVPFPAVEYFLQATEKAERQNAIRDYLLFRSGVVVSTVVAIVLKLAFGI